MVSVSVVIYQENLFTGGLKSEIKLKIQDRAHTKCGSPTMGFPSEEKNGAIFSRPPENPTKRMEACVQ